MRPAKRHLELLAKLTKGKVYRRDELAVYSGSIDRVLKRLENNKALSKVGPGLYYYPKQSRFGTLPPDEQNLFGAFLHSKYFLVMSNNLYNVLGVGLTQLSTDIRVYNTKRHDKVTLAGQQYYFQRPNNGFPKELSPEFLLVDLVNNIKLMGEEPRLLLTKITTKVNTFDKQKLINFANKYGKVGTRKFFQGLLYDNISSPAA